MELQKEVEESHELAVKLAREELNRRENEKQQQEIKNARGRAKGLPAQASNEAAKESQQVQKHIDTVEDKQWTKLRETKARTDVRLRKAAQKLAGGLSFLCIFNLNQFLKLFVFK